MDHLPITPETLQAILKKPAISSNELAAVTGLHPVTVRRKLAQGEIPSARIGGKGRHFIPHSFVVRFFDLKS